MLREHSDYAGVSEDKAGLAAGLLNSGTQLGAALGLAIFSAHATERTTSVLQAGHSTVANAATKGFQLALLVRACFMLAAVGVALLTRNRGPAIAVEDEPALELAA
jgi:hypothetical protein